MAKLNNRVTLLNTKIIRLENENKELKKQFKAMNVSIGTKVAHLTKK